MKDIINLLHLIKPHWKKAILNILLDIFSIIFSLFSLTLVVPFLNILFNNTPLVTAPMQFSLSAKVLQHNLYYFISEMIRNKGSLSALLFVCILVISASFFKNLFLYLARIYNISIRNNVAFTLQKKLQNKIIRLPLKFFSEEKKGDLISRFSGDVSQIKTSVTESLNVVFRDPINILIFLVYLFYSNIYLTIIVILSLPLIGLMIGRIGKSLKRNSIKGQKVLGFLVSEMEETITGLRIIKAFNAENKMAKKFEIMNVKYFKLMNKVERIVSLANPVSEFLGTIVVIGIMYLGGTLILTENKTMTSEEFIAFIVIFSQILTPAKNLTAGIYNIKKTSGSIKRINEILEAQDKIVEIENPVKIEEFKNKIEFKNVSFKYDNDYILKNINLVIEKGKTIALVGESGSGKSTLVDLIPRFYDIEEGEILIDNINIKNLSLKSLRNLMGNVNQTSILFNDTIENNIAFGVEKYTPEEIENSAKVANAFDFINEKPEKYQTNIGDAGSKLSGGQRQRLSIARAVMKNPPIMILDEATSALDTESEKLVQDALEKLMKNRTSIVIAHRLSTVKNADEICVLQNGEIIERGKHFDLIKNNKTYKRLCDLQMV